MLQWLLEQDFMPHGHCYYWRPDILWTHVLADGTIALAYFSIPITLLYFLRRRPDVPFPWLIALFATFIVLCGTTHIFDIWTIWHPVYVLDGWVRVMTALVSIGTALAIIPVVPQALALRSPAELETANQLLRAEVERRREAEKQLKAAVESLHRSNTALEQFASIASHDLQSPLRNIVSFTQLLQERHVDKLNDETREFMGFIVQNGKQMQTLIQDLLTFSRAGQQDSELVACDCEQILKQVESQMKVILQERHVQLTHDPLPTVSGVPHEVNQLLQNLISNAIKFQPSDNPRVHVSAERDGDYWRFSVRDWGIGIKPEHHSKIFQIFQRLHTRREFEGTGIGLALCQKIVTRHGGRIWVESEPDKGSTFNFTLSPA